MSDVEGNFRIGYCPIHGNVTIRCGIVCVELNEESFRSVAAAMQRVVRLLDDRAALGRAAAGAETVN